VKVGDLVDINQERGTGIYKDVTPRGLGVVVRFEELEDLHYEKHRHHQLGTYCACPAEHRRNRGVRSSELGVGEWKRLIYTALDINRYQRL
jgi:hypothetical protein